MKAADYIAARLSFLGIIDVFSVTGGAAMHLNDAFGSHPDLHVHYMHSEQACAMAAEGYARVAWNPAVVCVTAGPGAVNAMNGVFGAYTDSVPMIVISGQARSDTLTITTGLTQLRQLGDQELRTEETVRPITKWATTVTEVASIPWIVDQAFDQAVSGRPGPVWIDIPVNIQAQVIHQNPRTPRVSSHESIDEHEYGNPARSIIDELRAAHRPLILTGTGVRAAGVEMLLPRLARATNVPVVTAWTHDTIDSSDPLFAGRPGTIGTRAGNLAVQSADLLLVLGSRLNIRQVSYNWDSFAPHARIIHVDIDPEEFRKPYLKIDWPITADLRKFLPALLEAAEQQPASHHEAWQKWCHINRRDLEPRFSDYPVDKSGLNPYHFVMTLSDLLREQTLVVCGDATATIVPFQVMEIRSGIRLMSNSGCASMGYDLPAALGARIASPNRPVVCLAGDGSLMMNLQELQSLVAWGGDILLVILENDGYLSIKQTQSNFFGRAHGSSPASGVTFPDFSRIAAAFGLPVMDIGNSPDWVDLLRKSLHGSSPRVCVVHLAGSQEFEPRLKSRMTPDGIVTPPLDDMYPHLDEETLQGLRKSAQGIADG